MGHCLNRHTAAGSLARELGLRMAGPDLPIAFVAPLDRAAAGALCFSKQADLSRVPPGVIVIAPESAAGQGVSAILAPNPRLAFARALLILSASPGFEESTEEPMIDPTAKVSSTAVIGRGARIGARTVIGENVVVAAGVAIGEDCHVKSNSVIGEPGFGFERDERGAPVRILHLGSVVIGDRVEIGSLNTICRATLGQTMIESDVKTDDHVHIAHNCRIGRGTLITACAELSGGVQVGEFVWIGPNASVKQKVVMGDHAVIGIGANVTKDVESGATVAGNPAHPLRRLGP